MTIRKKTKDPIRTCRPILSTAAFLVAMLMLVQPGLAAVLVVSSTADSGPGTLRGQIVGANANPGDDEIIFAIPGSGPHTIQPLSTLPAITDDLVIDGYSQSGSAQATPSHPATLMIELDGTLAGTNTDGLFVSSFACTLQGITINRFGGNGIRLEDFGWGVIRGNHIGTDVTGTIDRGNAWHGVRIGDTSASTLGGTIGGSDVSDRNVISGNDSCGICGVYLNAFHHIDGNYIGTDATGTADVGNGTNGIELRSQAFIEIGGPLANQGNLISGNDSCGIVLNDIGPWGCAIRGNYIGTDVSGTAVLSNGWSGITVFESGGNYIGGTSSGARNIISANGAVGILLHESASIDNVIRGNYIGTDVTGTVALGNDGPGVFLINAYSDTIGGTATGSGNLISGNHHSGISLAVGSSGNLIQGNHIGTDVSGSLPMGNWSAGVDIWGNATANNTIGGVAANAGNVIAHNVCEGVMVGWVGGSNGNAILGNSIHSNGHLGIDLTTTASPSDGPTVNDPGDADTGPNNLQNHPVLTLAEPGPPVTLVEVFLNSSSSTDFRFEFFVNDDPDFSGYGEGGRYSAWALATTDAVGNVEFSVFFDPPVLPGNWITATATDPGGNTSEFSPMITLGDLMVLTGTRIAEEVILDWGETPFEAESWVYGAGSDTYFPPELDPPFTHRLDVLPPGATTWSSTNGVGDVDWNWTYLIVLIGNYGQEISRTNRFGEFDFGTGGP